MSEPATSVGSAPGDLLKAGRDAFARRAWQDAFDLLTSADKARALAGPDLEVRAGSSRSDCQASPCSCSRG